MHDCAVEGELKKCKKKRGLVTGQVLVMHAHSSRASLCMQLVCLSEGSGGRVCTQWRESVYRVEGECVQSGC